MRQTESNSWPGQKPVVGEMSKNGCINHINAVRTNPVIDENIRAGDVQQIAWGQCRRVDKVDSRTREIVHIDDAFVERLTY